MLEVGPRAQQRILAAAKANLEAGDWVAPTPPATLKLGPLTLRSHYNPNQPRDPGGEGGGRWVKTPGMGAPSVKTGPGRGPAGKLRNFEQMGDATLAALMADVVLGDDQEAKLAILAAAKKRGWASAKALPPKGTGGPSPAPKPTPAPQPSVIGMPTISGHDVNSAPPMRFEQAPLADVPKYVADPNIVFQQKIDGIRAQLVLSPGEPPAFRSSSGKQLVSSTAVQTTDPILEALPDYTGPPLVVDGEVLGGSFHVFDLIQPGQENRPYLERQAMADAFVKTLDLPAVKALPTARSSEDKQQLFDKVYANGGEGVMMKRADSPYTPGARVKHTLKAKFRSTVDAVIMERDRDGHHNFVLGLHDEHGVLQEIGTSSAIGKPDGQVGDVIEVAYLYAMPGSNSIVQPSVVKLRPDKTADQATVDQLRFVNKDVLDEEALAFASSAPANSPDLASSAPEPELPAAAGELPPAELKGPEPPDLAGWQKGDLVEHPTAGRATVIGPAPASKPGYINVSPEGRAGHSYWRTENLKAPENWLGEPMRMSGIQRKGFPPTPIAMLVTTGHPDMDRFASPALGRLLVPDMQDAAPATEADGVPFAADNGGFWGVDEAKYKQMCQKLHDQGVHPLWVTVPDVLIHPDDGPPYGDWEATANRFEQWQPYLENLGLPAALVAQDGLDSPEGLAWLEQRWDKFEALFIGGSDDFKLGPGAAKVAKLAHEHGKLVHVGRVNTAMRVSYARDVLHADSLDGQAWAKWKDKKLPGGLAYAPSGDAPPTAIGKAWITAAHEAQQNGGPWPRPPGHTKPIWPAGTFAQAPATIAFQDVSDALYRVGLSDYEHLRFTADEPGLSVELTEPRQAEWLARALGLERAAAIVGSRASWPAVLIVPDEDEDTAGAVALAQELTMLLRGGNTYHDPGGLHGGQFAKKGALDEGTSAKPSRGRGGSGTTPGAGGGTRPPEDSAVAGDPKDGGPSAAASVTAGFRPATDEDRARLKLPPAWTDVQVNPDPKGGLQAVGVDRKGRRQSVYSAEHHTQQAKAKFAKLRALHERMPAIVAQIEQDAEDGNQEAVAALLIQRTGLRPGSTKDTGADEQAYGASTLLDEHVSIDGDTVGLKFTGKKGVPIDLTVEDATLANVLRERLDEDPGGDLFDTDDAKLRSYLAGVQEGLRPKDFRTYLATATAYQMASETPPPTDEREFTHLRKQLGTRVSKLLGNTPEVALASYIDPAVFDPWAALLGIRAQEAQGV